MDQVKKGSKTLLDFFFQVCSAKICKSNKGLVSPTPGSVTNDPSWATSSFKTGKSHYLHSDEKSSENCPPSK